MQARCPDCGMTYELPPLEDLPIGRIRCQQCGVVFAVGSKEAAGPPPDGQPPALQPRPRTTQPDAEQRSARAGLSAIRAQSVGSSDPPGSAAREPGARGAGGRPAPHAGWLLRCEEGRVLSFKDFATLRAWMTAHPGREVAVSTDGAVWRTPAEILGMESLARREAPDEAAPLATVEQAGQGLVSPMRGRAGPVWSAAAFLSTMASILVALLTLHNTGTIELGLSAPRASSVLPGLIRGAEPVASEPSAPDPTQRDWFIRGREAEQEGRLLDAVMAYRAASEITEAEEVLEALARGYEQLGEGHLAARARERLRELETERTRDVEDR